MLLQLVGKKIPNVPRLETALIEAVGTKTQAPLAGWFLIRMDATPQLNKLDEHSEPNTWGGVFFQMIFLTNPNFSDSKSSSIPEIKMVSQTKQKKKQAPSYIHSTYFKQGSEISNDISKHEVRSAKGFH